MPKPIKFICATCAEGTVYRHLVGARTTHVQTARCGVCAVSQHCIVVPEDFEGGVKGASTETIRRQVHLERLKVNTALADVQLTVSEIKRNSKGFRCELVAVGKPRYSIWITCHTSEPLDFYRLYYLHELSAYKTWVNSRLHFTGEGAGGLRVSQIVGPADA
jgi:hypothetical protein